MALSVDTLVRCGVPAGKARTHLPFIVSAMREQGITTRVRARMFLAQVMHESAALRYFEEIASGAAYEGRSDLGNTRPGDGRRFKGRGPIQLTGRHNYTLYGKLLGLDLAGKPQNAATPRVGWRVAALFFERAGCNAAADRRDFRDVTRRINGGYNGYDDRVRYYRLLGSVGVVPGPSFLGAGDTGDGVVTMTRRLSFVRARGTGRPYLDGARKRFDEEAEEALRAFQRDHELEVDGRYGPKATRALARATAQEKRRRAKAAHTKPRPQASPSPAPDKAGRARTSAELLGGLDRLDLRGDRLRKALLERRRALERALEREHERLERAESARLSPDELRAFGSQLGQLDAMIHEVQEALAVADRPAHPAAVQRPLPAGAVKVGNGDTVTAVATGTEVEALGLDELAERLVALDAEEDRVRALLSERFSELEQEVERERAKRRRLEGRTEPARRPRPKRTPREKPVRRPRPKPAPDREDGPTGAATTVAVDARSFQVRQSKVALAAYLRRHRRQTTGRLRRTLVREVRSRKHARAATPTWERAVREAQQVAGLPVTGSLDGRLRRALRRDWPSESAMRRAMRATPAWRLIRGQLSPNFNVREFECTDGTDYVTGLVREQGLTKERARERAKQLADRLERLRRREGDRAVRVSSAFRTRGYNATLPGAATNSAHTRGYAVDVPPPSGVSLSAHHRHMRAVFESGVGIYATFVHGDFDPKLGRRDWRG